MWKKSWSINLAELAVRRLASRASPRVIQVLPSNPFCILEKRPVRSLEPDIISSYASLGAKL
ncbi:hypothetical protein, partial [Klebsiella quasipneumoniae]|uniref:hypothetical protein n=1 Tax=Klebsiella quasipneumoniae TaxID=1463165 RepID=UPI001C616B32